jgi:SAM-dependent methyltransferase
MKCVLEFFHLFYLRIFVAIFHVKEESQVKKILHKNAYFKKVDTILKKTYKGLNPYTIAKQFAEEKNLKEIHTYGETPLTSLYSILKKCSLSKTDHFFDLGCGRGRVSFFTHAYFGCSTTGVDFTPRFIHLAKQISALLPAPPSFLCQDMLKIDLSTASYIYFYALFLDDIDFNRMIEKFASLQRGTRIITVSFSLEEYSPKFKVLFSEEALFAWGKTEIFLNESI